MPLYTSIRIIERKFKVGEFLDLLEELEKDGYRTSLKNMEIFYDRLSGGIAINDRRARVADMKRLAKSLDILDKDIFLIRRVHTPGEIRLNEARLSEYGDRGYKGEDFSIIAKAGDTYRIDVNGTSLKDLKKKCKDIFSKFD